MATRKPVGVDRSALQVSSNKSQMQQLEDDEAQQAARSKGPIAAKAYKNKQRILKAQKAGKFTTSADVDVDGE